MAAKPSLHDALHNPPAHKAVPADPVAAPTAIATKKLIVEIPADAHFQIDRMRLDMRRNTMKELVTEALNDLFKKYDYPPIA